MPLLDEEEESLGLDVEPTAAPAEEISPEEKRLRKAKLLSYFQNAIRARTSAPIETAFYAFTGEKLPSHQGPGEGPTVLDMEDKAGQMGLRKAQIEKYLAEAKAADRRGSGLTPEQEFKSKESAAEREFKSKEDQTKREFESKEAEMLRKHQKELEELREKKRASAKAEEPATEGQLAAANFGRRAQDADAMAKTIEESGYNPADYGRTARNVGLGSVKPFKSEDDRRYEQAQKEFIAAVLRKESGGAITPDEFTEYGAIYFAQPGDTPAVMQQKADAREAASSNLIAMAGEKAATRVPSRMKTEQPPPGAVRLKGREGWYQKTPQGYKKVQ